jgi:hypothetical protein|tara:strand:- start:62 stop:340 length:279 start_codon:yes stop_codon:yes gene_type:complete
MNGIKERLIMKKFFLLSVLFIFMGDLSANQSTIIYKIEEYGSSISVFCIAGYVFVNYDDGTLTQVNEKVVMRNGTRYSVPMTCNSYRERIKK